MFNLDTKLQHRLLQCKNTNKNTNKNTTTKSNLPPVVMVVMGAQFQDESTNACHVPSELLVVDGSSFHNNNESPKTTTTTTTTTTPNTNGWDCTWPMGLHGIVNRILLKDDYHASTTTTMLLPPTNNTNKVMIQVIPILLEHSSTDFATIVARYGHHHDNWGDSARSCFVVFFQNERLREQREPMTTSPSARTKLF